MERAVLVGTDFSPSARRAVDLAVRLASKTGGALSVAHVWNPHALSSTLFSGSISVEPVMEAARAGAEAALQAEVERVRATTGVDVTGHFIEGVASREIVVLGRALDAPLIIAGRRGSANLSHALLGSVSERVARGADRPVLVVPEGVSELDVPERLVVGIDFSSAAGEALRVATRLSEALGCAPPLLLHAYQDERAEWLASWSETGRALHRSHHRAEIATWVERVSPESTGARVLSVEGAVDEQLVRIAREGQGDWIVLGLQGRTALASFLMGTTTRRVLELAEAPVLIVPALHAPERESID